ncbi:transporter [Limibacter armeniacum]|uniref:transporter n=1 Tax=Limibacter armeniacum TaxID=466084 RepID=UPI002FE50BEC
MTDLEFEVLDELYFVTSFKALKNEIEVEEAVLKNCLKELLEKQWVRCFKTVDTEEDEEGLDFENKYAEYYYLASKKGLMAHNRS